MRSDFNSEGMCLLNASLFFNIDCFAFPKINPEPSVVLFHVCSLTSKGRVDKRLNFSALLLLIELRICNACSEGETIFVESKHSNVSL